MIFLLPCDPLDSKKVDYDFQREFNAIVSLGFKVNLYDHANRWNITLDELIKMKDLTKSAFEEGKRQ